MAKPTKRTWITKEGKQKTCWAFDFTTKSGRRVRRCGFKTKVEAEISMSKAMLSADKTTYSRESKNFTLVEACNTYIELHAELHCKKTTCVGYKGYVKNHIEPFFENSKLKDITKISVDRFKKVKNDEGVSSQTINHLITFLKAVFQKMIDDEIISHNPLRKVKKLRVIHKKFEVLDSKEVEILLNTAQEHFSDFYPLIFTATFTGMRQGELLALSWDKIDWINRKIIIDANYTLREVTTPKSNKTRTIDMSEGLVKVLKEWKLRCVNNGKNLVFPNKEGNYIDPNNLNKRVYHPLIEKAGVKTVRFHDLRHTFASLLIAKNIPIKYIQSQLGHASIQMTMDTYGHILPEVTMQGVNALDSILN